MSNDNLGDRMKSYEDAYRTQLPIRLPVIIRIDGKAFHTYTATCKRPVDAGLVEVMNLTAIELCKQIQGTQIAYVQSDEISLLLTNYATTDTQSWFENNLQKMVSVAASIAGVTFSMNSHKIWGEDQGWSGWKIPIIKPAYFDARAFVLPKEDVTNYFLWRQQDATRNSVQMLARSLYSHKECTDKNNSELQEMCFQKGINWNDVPIPQKRGRCIIKRSVPGTALNKKTGETVSFQRSEWTPDNEIPIFSVDRKYIDRFVYPEAQ
jgi:tRNA(His) guanylyltransferase